MKKKTRVRTTHIPKLVEEEERGILTRHCLSRSNHRAVLLCFCEKLWLRLHVFIKGKDCCYVATSVAIVWCTPHRHQAFLLKHVLESFLNQLMSPAYHIQTINIVELRRNFATEKPACTPWTDGPGLDVLWITPHQVTEGSLVWNLTTTV